VCPALSNLELGDSSRSGLRSKPGFSELFAEILGPEQLAVMFELGGANLPSQAISHSQAFTRSHCWVVFRRASRLGCGGIVSKHKGSPYPPGRSSDWIKMKDPASPMVRREFGRGLGIT
jgi:hypothetical protein